MKRSASKRGRGSRGGDVLAAYMSPRLVCMMCRCNISPLLLEDALSFFQLDQLIAVNIPDVSAKILLKCPYKNNYKCAEKIK